MSYCRMTMTDRRHIEKYYNNGYTYRQIARVLCFAVSSIYREIQRGLYDHLDGNTWKTVRRYSADKAQRDAEYQATSKGTSLKLGHNYDYAIYVSQHIHKGWSPDVITGRLKREGKWTVCTTTLYTYIAKGYIPNVTNDNLWEKSKRKRTYKKVKPKVHKRPPAGQSIEKRPEEINARITPGHWEGDTVIGKSRGKGEALLVLTERNTRDQIIAKLPDKTKESVPQALDRIIRIYPRGTFKSITFDNGTEFSDCYRIEHDARGNQRLTAYYCHPYSSFERGSNENANKIIRRFFPKGKSMKHVTEKQVQKAQDFMNTLPRKILGYATPAEMLGEYLSTLR